MLPQRAAPPPSIWAVTSQPIPTTEGLLSGLNGAVPTLAGTLIRQQLEALPAVALKAADGVSAEVFAAAIVKLAFVDICGGTGEDILTALQADFLHTSVTSTCCNNGRSLEVVCELAI